MAEMNTVADGFVKFRDGKKWKLRWCAVRMPSPVADRLQVYLYKDCKDALKSGNAKSTFPLEGFYGIESGFSYEKECNVMAIICQKQVIMMSFETRELMIHFELRIRRSLGEEHQYPVRILKVPNGSKLPLENVRMHIHDAKFCFTAYIPPKMLQSWQISELRRFGLVESKFAFEGGSRCGKGAGVHVIATDQGDEVAEIFQAASEGKSGNNRKCPINKRRSQINDFSEGSFKPNYFKESSNPTCSADLDLRSNDYDWQKRHSISATDYGCAQGYVEKTKLISIENLENEGREHLLAIYDIPPRRIRKVECTSPHRNSLQSPSKNISAYHLERRSSNGSMTCEADKNSFLKTKKVYPSSDSFSPSGSSVVTSNGNVTSASEESASPSYKTNSAIDCEIDRAANQTRRQDAHDKLHREEEKLQREISLLDEMLQVCQLEETKPGTGESRSKFIVSMHTKSPSPSQRFTTTDMWVDTKPQQMVQFCNNSCSLNNNMTAKRSSTGFWEMLSPNFLPKLNKIPQKSNAPLPYINLDKYDAGDDRAHIPISSNGSAENLLEPNVNHSNYDNLSPEFGQGKLKLDYQNNSLHNLNENANRTDNADIRNRDLNHENSPPPKLPPKGPILQNRNSQRHLTSSLDACSTSPILRTSRRHTMSSDSSSSSDLSPYHVPKISYPLVVRMRDHEAKDPTEPYLLMSGFSKEDKSPVFHNDVGMASGYMDMTGQFEMASGKFDIPSSQPPPACLPVEPVPTFTPEISPINQCPPPPPLNTMPNEMWSQPVQSGYCEENYMEMGGSPKCSFTKNLQNLPPVGSAEPCVSQSKETKVNSSTNDCNTVPFPNLKNVLGLNAEKGTESSSVNSSPTKPACKDKSQENAGKSPGFFSRLMRRNSKDQAKNSQSHENLSASICSLERSNSIQDNIYPVNNVDVAGAHESVPIECPHLSIERQRSSSFPSENCFHDMLPEGPKCKAAHNLSGFRPPGYSSFPTTNRICNHQISPSNICNHTLPLQGNCNNHCSCQSADKKKTNLLNDTHYLDCHSLPNDSYLNIPCENNSNVRLPNTRESELEENESEKESYQNEFSDSYIYMGPLCKEEKFKAEKFDEPSCESIAPEKQNINVLRVQGDFMVEFRGKDSSKTDDEKLFELYQSCKSKHKEDEGSPVDFPIAELKEKFSLALNKPISPDEQAAAIARHVAELPPFIPPKTKPHPCSLSPVFETNSFIVAEGSSLVEQKCDNDLNLNQTEVLQPPFQLKDLSDYVQQKQQVQSSLRIAPASDAAQDTVWVLRDADPADNENVMSSNWKQTKTDECSQSSETSPVEGTSENITIEDNVRSSPASTILRPRSGKEYQLVERKKSEKKCGGAFNLETCSPQSPLKSLVFTFDNLFPMSSHTADGYSPPVHQKQDPSYVNLGQESDMEGDPMSSYMNVDMTPPCSPYTKQLMEQAELQLNYAEIDLSSPPANSNQSKTISSRSSVIDYATIDMVATVAAQKAGREHAQSRGDCFQNVRKCSSPNLSKEQKGNGQFKDKSL